MTAPACLGNVAVQITGAGSPWPRRRSEPVIPDKPTEHEPWSEVGVAGFALKALGVVVAMAILMFGLM